MKLCEYLNNTMEISIISSMIADRKIIEVGPPYIITSFEHTKLGYVSMYSGFASIDVHIRAKPVRSKYAYLTIYTLFTYNEKRLSLIMTGTNKLEIVNSIIIQVKFIR
ncbi:MAG: hypothetical protein ACPL1B_09710 [Thermoprotei archaeon]